MFTVIQANGDIIFSVINTKENGQLRNWFMFQMGPIWIYKTLWGDLRAALWRRPWGYWWMKSWTWPSNVCSQPGRPTVPWAASRESWPAGWGGWFYPSAVLWWDPTWRPASSSGASSTGKTQTCWSGSRGDPQQWSEGWNTSPMRKGWESWGCPAWIREGCGETLLQLSST